MRAWCRQGCCEPLILLSRWLLRFQSASAGLGDERSLHAVEAFWTVFPALNPARSCAHSTVLKGLNCTDAKKLPQNQAGIRSWCVTDSQRPEAWAPAVGAFDRKRKWTASARKCSVHMPPFKDSVA